MLLGLPLPRSLSHQEWFLVRAALLQLVWVRTMSQQPQEP